MQRHDSTLRGLSSYACAILSCFIGLSSARAQTAEELLVKHASWLEDLGDKSFLLHATGLANDAGGPTNGGMKDIDIVYLQDDSGKIIYTSSGSQYHEAQLHDSGMMSSVQPSGVETKAFSDGKSGDFYARRAFLGIGKTVGEAEVDADPATAKLKSPQGNLGYLGTVSYNEYYMRNVTSAARVDKVLSMVFIDETTAKNGDVVGQWYTTPKKYGKLSIRFSRSSSWQPVEYRLTRVDESGDLAPIWECQTDWRIVDGFPLQQASIERNYFLNGKVKELRLQYSWLFDSDDHKFDFAGIRSYGIVPNTREVDLTANWRDKVLALFENEKFHLVAPK